ncbi:MAG: hypothetical protein AAGJ81_14290 [Verrucomicrobiota bacterium]
MTPAFILCSLIAGALGAVAMSYSMRLISRLGGGDEVDMVIALGSFFSRTKKNATQFGLGIHLGSGLLFGVIYGLLFSAIGITHLFPVVFVGIGFGILHGLGMAYVLMIYMAEKHPLEEFREVSLIIGAIHFFGHIVYGAVVGVVIGVGTSLT